MIDVVKRALRISHSKLDLDILDSIEVAKAEMVRLSISPIKIESGDALVRQAIRTYCLYNFCAEEKRKAGYLTSWNYQLEAMRKSRDYMEV